MELFFLCFNIFKTEIITICLIMSLLFPVLHWKYNYMMDPSLLKGWDVYEYNTVEILSYLLESVYKNKALLWSYGLFVTFFGTNDKGYSLFQTTATWTLLRDARAGRWYQWRVASVAINGTRGFSPPTKPYKLNTGTKAYSLYTCRYVSCMWTTDPLMDNVNSLHILCT